MPKLMEKKEFRKIILNLTKIDLQRAMKIVKLWGRDNKIEFFFKGIFQDKEIKLKEKTELLDILKAQSHSYSGRIADIADYFLTITPDIES